MRINQNVMANNASRNLAGTSVQLGKSLEKLSSGFRINRAADDAVFARQPATPRTASASSRRLKVRSTKSTPC
jgi:flagellin-like hook-associated protein FlgL